MREYYDLLRSTSRTFAVGIEALPGELRDAVTLAYLVLRVSDYFEDSPTLSAQEKRSQLTAWAGLLEGAEGPFAEAYAPLLDAVSPEDRELPDHAAALQGASILDGLTTLRADFRDPIRRHTADTTRGMAEWAVRGDDFPDEAALDTYMFEVAGRVGLLLTDLFVAHSPRIAKRAAALRATAVSFGLGLQTVNVIRGLHEDPARGWSYIPRELLRDGEATREGGVGDAAGGSRLDPRTLNPTDQARILDFLVRKSGRHIADALAYCLALPRRERGIRTFCVIPALLAAETARRSRGNLEVFRGPVKVGRSDVRRLVARTRLLFFSNGWLERERNRAIELSSRPLGPPGDAGPRAPVR